MKNTRESQVRPKLTSTARTTWKHTLRAGRAEKPQTEVRGPSRKLTITPDPNGDTKPSVRSKTNKPRPRRGDPIAKAGNYRGEENPPEQGELEPVGWRRTGKKPRNGKAQQAVCAPPKGQQGSTPKAPG